jgi:hypothetical protein
MSDVESRNLVKYAGLAFLIAVTINQSNLYKARPSQLERNQTQAESQPKLRIDQARAELQKELRKHESQADQLKNMAARVKAYDTDPKDIYRTFGGRERLLKIMGKLPYEELSPEDKGLAAGIHQHIIESSGNYSPTD